MSNPFGPDYLQMFEDMVQAKYPDNVPEVAEVLLERKEISVDVGNGHTAPLVILKIGRSSKDGST